MRRPPWWLLPALFAAAVVVLELVPRGVRNNNPGNLRRSSDDWLGLAAEQPDPVFFSFVSPEYGLRALGVVLLNYFSRYGLDTVRGIVSRYAPPAENDTETYVADVAARLGVGPDDELDVAGRLPELMHAIVLEENGVDVASSVYDSALAMLS